MPLRRGRAGLYSLGSTALWLRPESHGCKQLRVKSAWSDEIRVHVHSFFAGRGARGLRSPCGLRSPWGLPCGLRSPCWRGLRSPCGLRGAAPPFLGACVFFCAAFGRFFFCFLGLHGRARITPCVMHRRLTAWSDSASARRKPAMHIVRVVPVYTPLESMSPMFSWMAAKSYAGMSVFDAWHLRGM